MEVERRVETSAAAVIGFGREEKSREMTTTEVGPVHSRPSLPTYPYQPLTCRPSQSQAVSPALSPRSSFDFSSTPVKPPKSHRHNTAYVRKSVEEVTLISQKLRDFHMETDFQIPRIRYESESESSDEECLRRIQQKYQGLL